MYKQTTKINGALRSNAVTEVLDQEPKADKKSLSRLQIQEEVFDNSDSIADNAKMISLMMTLVSRIYNVLDDTQKDNLSTDDRNLIEYTFNKFSNTNTRADVQFASEGITLIDKLLDRQASIGNIVK